MNVQAAIFKFSQSEKIKAGLIWASQVVAMLDGIAVAEQRGAEKMIKGLIGMIAQEIHIARNLAPDGLWDEAEKHLDMAQVMINSQMVQESGFHLTRALTQVTSMVQRSLSFLKDEGLV